MKYNIKKDHPVINVIHNEIQQVYKDIVAIAGISIDTPINNTDIYGFNFNANANKCLTINCCIYYKPKEIFNNTPLRIESLSPESKKFRGYDYYTYSSNCAIKLSNFISRFPHYSNLEDWTEKVKNEKISCKYSGHNTTNKTVSIRLPNSETISIKWPDNITDSNLLTWVKPIEEAETKKYYRQKAFDKLFNIKREQIIWIKGVWLSYDYINGLVEIKSIRVNNQNDLISKKLFDIGLINKESLNNEIVKTEIEQSLFDNYDEKLSVNKIIIKYYGV